jgi:hypothetical protein
MEMETSTATEMVAKVCLSNNSRPSRSGQLTVHPGDVPEYWQPLGLQFTGKDKGDLDGLRFVDINGDVRSITPSISGYKLTENKGSIRLALGR